ncbi:hypothetical protein GCM10011415_14320 [Salipiger pallidus]|uniref:Multidrug resistance protein MdtA-like barrel-sandwich hybrid domain-containing protein n=1 Tax=Salipiger pallidus TaxID=1775170 RepID=A0A8J2ZID8_9RHOB|nr:HlyD family efflux transporter periplasmic adaptor subunit [Salipiger pallidus]GGG68269.1 hypothetical protein GCM10011415_14320 [Salipiger pallidus]
MRFLRQSLVGLFLFSVALGLLLWASVLVRDAVQTRLADSPRIPEARERVFAVNVMQAVPGQVTPVLSAFGAIQSARTLELRTAVAGTLTDFAPGFVDGGRVQAGQLLARIDPADMQAELSRAVSALTDAEAELREARLAVDLEEDALGAAEEQAALRQRAFERQRDLAARNVATAAAAEDAELSAASARQAVVSARQALALAGARVDQAETSLERARIARDDAQRRLDETEIRAPFDAQLTDVSVVSGRRVSANEMLATLIDPETLEVSFRVSTQQYARLLSGGGLPDARVSVRMDLWEESLATTGILTREGAAVGEGQTGRLLYAALDRAAGFKPGDFVTVEVTEALLDDVVRLPATALDASGDVLVLTGDNRLETLPVTLLRRQGDDVLVRAAALEGREVVMERTPLLGAGILVRPMRVDDAARMLDLTEDRRARLLAFVEASDEMPEADRQTLRVQLAEDRVPAAVVERIEQRMGG